MKVAGAVYQADGSTSVALYNSYPDIYSALPPRLEGKHEIHVKYAFGNQHSSIDIYKIAPSSVDYIKNNIKLKNIFNINDIDIKTMLNTVDICNRQDVKFEVVEELRDTERLRALAALSAKDIDIFSRESAKVLTDEEPLMYTPKIIPVTAIRYVKARKPVTSGKADYVDCKLDANIDFVMAKGECVSSFLPGQDSKFTGDKFIGFYHDKSGDCQYCYASHHHLEPYPKAFVGIDMNQLYEILMYGKFTNYNDVEFGKHVDVARAGKRTEPGAIYHRKQLKDLIEVCIRSQTDLDIPTKYLEYDPEIVDLCNKARTHHVNINILHSITHLDDLERGPTVHGCNNAWRIEQNRLYADAGVNSVLFMMTELAYDTRQEFLDTIQYALDEGLTLQLLGARITKKDIAERITGRTWEQLKGKLRMEPHMHDGQERLMQCGGYALTGNTQLSPQVINPHLLDIVGKNQGQIRLCHHTNAKEYCGVCFLGKGFVKNFKKKDTSIKKIYNHFKTEKPEELSGKLDLEFKDKNNEK